MILCITPNPAVDRTLVVPGFAAGRVSRAARVHVHCGGKGVNVARTLRRLGKAACCAGPLGGLTGRLAAERARAEGLDGRWTQISGETRTCVIIAGDGTAPAEATVINEPGPSLSADEWERLLGDVARLASDASAVCISGSLPGSAATGHIGRLIAAAGPMRRAVWVDTSGPPLAEAAAAPVSLKVNAEEAGALLGRPPADADATLAAARGMLTRGPRRVVITLGEAGAVMATGHGGWHAVPPPVAAVNPVGSGDSFLAGLLAGFGDGLPPAAALRLAVACGAANAMSEQAGDVAPETVSALAAATTVRAL